MSVGSSYWQKGKKHSVVRVEKHPDFTFQEFRNDVAILKVSPRIQFKKGRVTPICLPPKNLEIFGSGTIAGWGLTANENSLPNDYLLRVNIEILEDSHCLSKYPNYSLNQMICAGRLQGGEFEKRAQFRFFCASKSLFVSSLQRKRLLSGR